MNQSGQNNAGLNNAARERKDEFYTQITDIEKELRHYRDHFRDKVVYCNCDDPRESGFYRYFSMNFELLGIKKLIATCYKNQSRDIFSKNDTERAVYLEYLGDIDGNRVPDPEETEVKNLQGDGDFRSQECIELLKEADIVVSNPPFSLFREYIAQLIEYNKMFLILGNVNSITYTEVFPLFQENIIWFGPSIKSGDREFRVPEHYPLNASGIRVDSVGNKYIRVKGVRWITNLDYRQRHEDMILYKEYSLEEYSMYINYPAIEVSKVSEIPRDYDGEMGVPITYLDKHNPKQFNIIGSSRELAEPMTRYANRGTYSQGGPRFYIDNGNGTYRRLFDRIVIQRRRN